MSWLIIFILGIVLFVAWKYFVSYPKLRIRNFPKYRAFRAIVQDNLLQYMGLTKKNERPKIITHDMAYKMIFDYVKVLKNIKGMKEKYANDANNLHLTKSNINNISLISQYILENCYDFKLDIDDRAIITIYTKEEIIHYSEKFKWSDWI